MDPEITKIATEATEAVAKSVVKSVVQKILSFASAKPNVKAATRELKNRGEWERRNGSGDRRISGVDQRLRKGFSLEYFRKTGAGKFETQPLSRQTRQDLFDALVAEAKRYQFSVRSTGSVLEPAFVIETALEVKWDTWCSRPQSENKAVLLLEEIAEYLLLKYNVSRIDRRKQQRRQIKLATG